MYARVATFDQLDPEGLDQEAVERLRRSIRSTPGYRAGFHVRDSRTGKALSITVWDSPEAVQQARSALSERDEGERVGIDPDAVEFFDEVIEF
jgi:heme-degrading monooxygenase HmoA